MLTYNECYQADPRDWATTVLLVIEEIRQAQSDLFDRPMARASGIDVVEAKYRQILKGEQ